MQNNSKVVAKNTIYAFIIKGGGLVVSFFSAPVFIGYFNNNEVLGLWYTMLSMLMWFLSFDMGIGNGIRNHLVIALVNNDRLSAKRIISSGTASVAAITLLLTIIGICLIYNLNLNSVFNIRADIIGPSALRLSTVFVFTAIMLRFMLTIVSSVFYSLQRSAVNNFLSFCISILQLAYILIFHFENVESALIYVSLAYLIISTLPVIIAGVVIFVRELRDCCPHPKFITIDTMKQIMSIGFIFFFCQILYLLITNTNEFFVSYFWGPGNTIYYTFYYKLTMIISMMVSLALTPIWSMVTKAYSEKNYVWLKNLYKLLKYAGFAIIALQFLLIPFMQPIMNAWLGRGIVDVNYVTAFAFACFGASFIYSSILSTIVCGLARMRLQLICYAIGVLAKVILIVMVARISSDWTWVVWSNVICLAPYCIIQLIDLNNLFRRLSINT